MGDGKRAHPAISQVALPVVDPVPWWVLLGVLGPLGGAGLSEYCIFFRSVCFFCLLVTRNGLFFLPMTSFLKGKRSHTSTIIVPSPEKERGERLKRPHQQPPEAPIGASRTNAGAAGSGPSSSVPYSERLKRWNAKFASRRHADEQRLEEEQPQLEASAAASRQAAVDAVQQDRKSVV